MQWMKITILTDNKKSWFVPYGEELRNKLINLGHSVEYVSDKEEIAKGDVCFLLSCTNIVPSTYLERSLHNIVVHASDLPKGKGFAPMQWQIMEGKNEIVLTLFEVVDKVDAGPYYIKDSLRLDGTELYKELRDKLAYKIISMCIHYVNEFNSLVPLEQKGIESFYKRRAKEDDMLDPNKTIADQFDHFRIADNDKYPLWFTLRGRKYILKIFEG